MTYVLVITGLFIITALMGTGPLGRDWEERRLKKLIEEAPPQRLIR